MRTDIDMRPVERDPKKLWLTAIILVIIMIVGGILILTAYQKRATETASNNRPSYVTKISKTKDLIYLKQDGAKGEMMDLKGKILIIQNLPSTDVEELETQVMQRLSEKFADVEDIQFLTLMLDPGKAEDLQGELSELASELGAELPKWIVASNERKTLHKFVKNEFKASKLPREVDGVWGYDRSIVLIDRDRHVRRAVVPQKRGGAPFVTAFDFEKAQQWDKEKIKTGTELSNVEQLEVLLIKTIETLLIEEPDQ